MTTMESRTLTIPIDRGAADVYAFVSNPENLPRWASGLSRSIRRQGDDWVTQTPQGPMRLRFAAPNRFGVLDHTVTPREGAPVHVPMRVVPNGAGSEILFTLFRRPGMTAEAFKADAALVRRDLEALKRLLEAP